MKLHATSESKVMGPLGTPWWDPGLQAWLIKQVNNANLQKKKQKQTKSKRKEKHIKKEKFQIYKSLKLDGFVE